MTEHGKVTNATNSLNLLLPVLILDAEKPHPVSRGCEWCWRSARYTLGPYGKVGIVGTESDPCDIHEVGANRHSTTLPSHWRVAWDVIVIVVCWHCLRCRLMIMIMNGTRHAHGPYLLYRKRRNLRARVLGNGNDILGIVQGFMRMHTSAVNKLQEWYSSLHYHPLAAINRRKYMLT